MEDGVRVARPHRVILVGGSGSGKSVIGARLQHRLVGWTLLDTDEALRQEFRTDSITEIFDTHGELAFRSAEERLASACLVGPERLVIATGGGLPASGDSMSFLLEAGLTFFLRASPALLWRRLLSDQKKMRDLPMLRDGGLDRLTSLMDLREPIYERAHFVVDTDRLSVDEVVEAIGGIVDGLL